MGEYLVQHDHLAGQPHHLREVEFVGDGAHLLQHQVGVVAQLAQLHEHVVEAAERLLHQVHLLAQLPRVLGVVLHQPVRLGVVLAPHDLAEHLVHRHLHLGQWAVHNALELRSQLSANLQELHKLLLHTLAGRSGATSVLTRRKRKGFMTRCSALTMAAFSPSLRVEAADRDMLDTEEPEKGFFLCEE